MQRYLFGKKINLSFTLRWSTSFLPVKMSGKIWVTIFSVYIKCYLQIVPQGPNFWFVLFEILRSVPLSRSFSTSDHCNRFGIDPTGRYHQQWQLMNFTAHDFNKKGCNHHSPLITACFTSG